jgi:hypothetical protein
MGRFEIGEYLAIVQNRSGQETGRMMLVPRKRFPCKGEGISVGEKRYRVLDIVHPVEESDQFDRFLYTDLVAYLVDEAEGGSPPGGLDPDSEDEGTPPKRPAHLASVVVPFRGEQIDAASPLLVFMKLIAVAVARGYEEQAYELERLKFASWSLDWSGDRWVAERIAEGRTAGELRELSRVAKRAQAEAEAFCRQLLPVVAAETRESFAEVIELAAFRRG